MLARHVRELSRAAPPRAAPRAPSLPAFAARPPARPAPPRARPYHSRWALSVYGPEPGTPPEDLVGYEEELAEFERNKDELRRGMADGGGETRGDEAASRADRSPSTADAHATNADDERRWAREHADVVDLNAWATGANVAAAETAARRRSAANASVSSAYDPGTTLRDDARDPAAVSSSESTAPLRPGLYLVGTPIGNLEDITLRALRVLRTADAILAEDTRHTARLLRRYGIETRGRLVSYHAHNLRARRDGVVRRLRGGDALALVSDAGTPAVADPGADLAAACAEEGLAVVPVPGPCAPAAAVGAAGLWGFATSAGARRANDGEKTAQSSSDFLDSSDDDDADDDDRSRGDAEEVHRSDARDAACDDDAARSVGTPSAPPSIDREGFTFVGFLPPKPGPRKKRLRLFADAPGAVVAFVPPHKLVATLEDCAEVFGAGRRCAVCREMTKVRDPRRTEVFFFFFLPSPRLRGSRRARIIPQTKLLLPRVHSDRGRPTLAPGTVTTKHTTKA